jgi:hypothetical protein
MSQHQDAGMDEVQEVVFSLASKPILIIDSMAENVTGPGRYLGVRFGDKPLN